MATPQVPPKKPRLSLQIKTSCSPVTRSSRSYAVDPTDPTAFNTLSNVYVTAIERSAPTHAEPLTAINTLEAFTLATPIDTKDTKNRVVTPHVAFYPETPVSDGASSPRPMEVNFPSIMTATPPLSAGPAEGNNPRVFSFSAEDISAKSAARAQNHQSEARNINYRPMPRILTGLGLQPPPYTHPRTLHSILRNSPLPPPTAIPVPSPRRQYLRLQEKAAKRVGYDNPLTQEIITNKYTRSHIDLLVEEASPRSPPSAMVQPQTSLDLAMAFHPNEIRDGGQTPGPFEDMRLRMAGLGAGTPSSPGGPGGIRKKKKKKKEKKQRWVWTIGQDDDDDNEHAGGSIMALRAEAAKANEEPETPLTAIPIENAPEIKYLTPTPSVESGDSECESQDVEMSDTSSCLSQPEDHGLAMSDMDLDVKTPTASWQQQYVHLNPRLDAPNPSVPTIQGQSFDPISNRDTPVPPDMA